MGTIDEDFKRTNARIADLQAAGFSESQIEAAFAADPLAREPIPPAPGGPALPSSALDQLRAATTGQRADHLARDLDWDATTRTLRGLSSDASAPLTPAEATPEGLAKLAKADPDRLQANWPAASKILADHAANASKKGATR